MQVSNTKGCHFFTMVLSIPSPSTPLLVTLMLHWEVPHLTLLDQARRWKDWVRDSGHQYCRKALQQPRKFCSTFHATQDRMRKNDNQAYTLLALFFHNILDNLWTVNFTASRSLLFRKDLMFWLMPVPLIPILKSVSSITEQNKRPQTAWNVLLSPVHAAVGITICTTREGRDAKLLC